MNVAEIAERVARRKLADRLTDDDAPCVWVMERRNGAPTGACLISFAEEGRTRSGKRVFGPIAGKRVRVSSRELAEEAARYERETGRCADCLGAGKVVKSWSATQGTHYRDCAACSGSGAPQGRS